MATWFDQRKNNKYGNRKAIRGDKKFGSEGEAQCYDYLKLLELGGELTVEKLQDNVYLTAARILYKADFRTKNARGETVWVEFKGCETDTWRIKRRLWKHYGPGKLMVYKLLKGRITHHETIEPKGRG